jgi:hypothetical protein
MSPNESIGRSKSAFLTPQRPNKLMPKAAKAPDAPAATLPDPFDPKAQYRVTLKSAIELGGITMRPTHDVVLRGDVAERSRESIASATRL